MRKVNYLVVREDGTKFQTTHYTEAKECGNRILETFLTPIDEKTAEQREKERAHAQKIVEHLRKKGN